jgi:Ca2+-binding RTX toxin-like protein
VDAGAGDDTITVEGADDVTAGNGNDTVTLTDVANVKVTLGDGNDTVTGGATVTAADTLTGGDGTDVLQLNAGSTAGAEGADKGTDATSTISFDGDFTGFETITLAAGAASVDSSTDGKDKAGALNKYEITLGDATNVAATKVLTVDGSALRAGVITGIGDGTDDGAVRNIGESDTTGSETLTLTATAISGSVSVLGGAGNDTITTSAQADTIVSGAGNDVITSNAGNDSISAGDGTDNINAGDGDNTVDGGAGNDTITSGTGNDVITTGAGDHTVTSGGGNDSITANIGNDSITAGDGNDTIVAGDGNDTVEGGNGVDVIDLGGGSDVLVYTAVANSTGTNFDDVSNFTSGTDRLLITVVSDAAGVTGFDPAAANTIDLSGLAVVGSFADGLVSLSGNGTTRVFSDGFYSTTEGKLYIDSNGDGQINQSTDMIIKIGTVAVADVGFSVNTGAGADTVTGGAGNDTLLGEAAADSLTGGAGNDSIVGGAGGDADVDTITGGTGADTMTGGGGNDLFFIATAGDSGITLATADRITDFVGNTGDVLRLGLAGTGTNYSEAGAAVADFAAALTAANTALAALNGGAGGADVHLYNFQFDATNGYLFIDRDSNGTADEVVVLVGVTNTGIGAGDIGGP